MSRAPLIAASALCLAMISPAHAMYKCVIAGTVTYSQEPCAENATPIQVAPARGRAPAPQAEGDRSGLERQVVADMEKSRRLRNIDFDIDRAEREITRLRSRMDSDLAGLRARQRDAANNLAGATLEGSISTEMQAVVARYRSEIDVQQAEIAALRAERTALTAP